MIIERKKNRQIMVGNVPVGGGAPVSVQSMTDTLTTDIKATLNQVRALELAGCDIVRIAIPDQNSVAAFKEIKKEVSLPLIADIHFDHLLALGAIDAGADGIRINPGNIGSHDKTREIIQKAGQAGVSIRIGVNSGSLEHDLEKEHKSLPHAMVASVLRQLEIFYKEGFDNLKIALKSSNVSESVDAYRIIAGQVDYPLHIGITEAGGAVGGTVKSAIGLGILLSEGIGDTLRVSLTADPVDEVKAGWEILKALDIRQRGVRIISCPTCARKEYDVASLVNLMEKKLEHIKKPITISILGCVVNGVGEGKHADLGIAGGKNSVILFKKGKVCRKVDKTGIVEAILKEVETLV